MRPTKKDYSDIISKLETLPIIALVTTGRCGSDYLQSLIDGHSQVITFNGHFACYSEFFNSSNTFSFGNINDIYYYTKQFVAFRNSYLELGEIWENWFFGANKNNIVLVDIIKKIQHKIRLSNKSVDWQETFLPFSNTVNQFKNKEWFFDISNSAHQIVGHIAAHDNWHNKDYFNNGGPTSV